MESRPGDTYSFRVLPGRDPEETFNGTLIDHEVGNVEDAQRIVTASASSFAGLRGPTGVFDEGESEETHDTSSRRRLVQRREGDDGEHVGEPSPVFLPKLHSQHAVTSGKLGSYVSKLSL